MGSPSNGQPREVDTRGRPVRILKDGTKVVWEPLAGSQTLSLTCPANIIQFDGSRGPGKTDAQLMRFRRCVGQGYGRYWRGIIFDREYKNLDDLVSKSMRWFPEFKAGARFLSSKSDYRWYGRPVRNSFSEQSKKIRTIGVIMVRSSHLLDGTSSLSTRTTICLK